jgi:hypothetical protein
MEVHPAKQARAQVAGNVSGLSFASLDPSTSKLMSTLWHLHLEVCERVSHPPTLKFSGSNPHGGRKNKFFSVAKKDCKCFISVK